MTGRTPPPHGPEVCDKTPCAVCWAPGGLGLTEEGVCKGPCAYGTCGGGPNPCGGCCGCLGGCIVQYENRQMTPPARGLS